jgi:hypothetical protein
MHPGLIQKNMVIFNVPEQVCDGGAYHLEKKIGGEVKVHHSMRVDAFCWLETCEASEPRWVKGICCQCRTVF